MLPLPVTAVDPPGEVAIDAKALRAAALGVELTARAPPVLDGRRELDRAIPRARQRRAIVSGLAVEGMDEVHVLVGGDFLQQRPRPSRSSVATGRSLTDPIPSDL